MAAMRLIDTGAWRKTHKMGRLAKLCLGSVRHSLKPHRWGASDISPSSWTLVSTKRGTGMVTAGYRMYVSNGTLVGEPCS